jgi:hypothetical protein
MPLPLSAILILVIGQCNPEFSQSRFGIDRLTDLGFDLFMGVRVFHSFIRVSVDNIHHFSLLLLGTNLKRVMVSCVCFPVNQVCESVFVWFHSTKVAVISQRALDSFP